MMREFFLYIKMSAKEYYKIYFPLKKKYHSQKSLLLHVTTIDICSKQVYKRTNDSFNIKIMYVLE